MKIIIPTYKRPLNQFTLTNLTPRLRENTVLVIPAKEREQHKFRSVQPGDYWIQPDEITTIAAKRQWILEEAQRRAINKLIMLDDDMEFHARDPEWEAAIKSGKSYSLKKGFATSEKIEEAFKWVESMLDMYPHVGISSRQGNNNVKKHSVENTRMMHAIAYDVEKALSAGRFDAVDFREDMHMTLCMLKKGMPNIVLYTLAVSPKSYGAKGGCSDERTVEKSNDAAVHLSLLHPGLVKVEDRDYSSSIPRKEVRVAWKKAFAG